MLSAREIVATALLSSAELACTAEETAEQDRVITPRAVDAGDASTPILDEPVDEEACQRIAADAAAYLDTVMDCTTDRACDIRNGGELVEDPCLPILLCYVPISDSVDLQAVTARLEQLDRDYREVCRVCPTALCIDPDRIFSTCDDATCELNVAPPIDAFTI